MRYFRTISAAFLSLCLGIYSCHAAEFNFAPKTAADSVKNFLTIQPAPDRYPEGESLVYKIIWMGIPIGNGKISLVRNEGEDYAAEVIATGNDFLNAFFPVEDVLRSEFSGHGYSRSFEKNVREGKYEANEIIRFDYEEELARYSSLTNLSEKQYPIDGSLHDVLSAFYWVRKQPMRLGDSLQTDVFNDEKTWGLNFNVTQVKKIRLSEHGEREAIVLEPTATVDGKEVGAGKVKIYVSNDDQRIPLLVKLKTPFGPVVGELTGIYHSVG